MAVESRVPAEIRSRLTIPGPRFNEKSSTIQETVFLSMLGLHQKGYAERRMHS